MPTITPLLRDRWSPRAWAATPVTDEEVALLVEAARWAPSARNRQPWRFLVGRPGEASYELMAGHVGMSEWALGAPLLVLNVAVDWPEPVPVDFPLYDLGQAVAHMTVQASALGLFGRQFASFDRAGLTAALGLPASQRAVTMTAFGRLRSDTEPPVRERVDAVELLLTPPT